MCGLSILHQLYKAGQIPKFTNDWEFCEEIRRIIKAKDQTEIKIEKEKEKEEEKDKNVYNFLFYKQ